MISVFLPMMPNLAFALKAIIYSEKPVLASPDKEILQKLYYKIHSQKEIPDNDANLLVVFGKNLEQLEVERYDNMLKIFDEIADILVDPNRSRISNFMDNLIFDIETLQEKLKNASFVFVQKESEEFLNKFHYFCREITCPDNQKEEIFEKHLSLEILEKERVLANFFLIENPVCLEPGQCESLQLLETKFNDHIMIQCTKPPAAIPDFHLLKYL